VKKRRANALETATFNPTYPGTATATVSVSRDHAEKALEGGNASPLRDSLRAE
ncbi:hypothetical protein H632_c1451p0, partial [Helicosporidium sp. ATCC 50920]